MKPEYFKDNITVFGEKNGGIAIALCKSSLIISLAYGKIKKVCAKEV